MRQVRSGDARRDGRRGTNIIKRFVGTTLLTAMFPLSASLNTTLSAAAGTRLGATFGTTFKTTFNTALQAQASSPGKDSTRATKGVDSTLVQGGVYNRPFIASVGEASIGGYLEANSNHHTENGLSDGFSMEIRRFNIFVFAPIGHRLRFLSELEFEHGTKEIAIETAQLDFQIDPRLVIRAGILLPPIGAFNSNHDSPRWDFIDRPLVSTEIIPSTLSEAGAGIYGRFMTRGLTLTYDAYLTNGLGDGVILNETGRTYLAAGKHEDIFAADNNGSPARSGRVAVQHTRFGELGLSFYGGAYNSYRSDGAPIDDARHVSISAVDFNTSLGTLQLRGELARVRIDIPSSLTELFGSRQWGGHLDAVAPIWRPKVLGFQDAVLSALLRIERVDYNAGRFSSTGLEIGDEVTAIVPGFSFRPVPETVFKFNARFQNTRDFPGNRPVPSVNYQVGIATYF